MSTFTVGEFGRLPAGLNYVWDTNLLDWVVMTQSSGGPTADVNLNQVAGASVKTGNGTATGAQRVAVASDSTFTVTANPSVATPVRISALTTGVTAVRATGATLDSYYILNPNASVAYVQIFNAATGSVSLGSTAPTWSVGIPPTSAANLSNVNLSFGTAISVAATTTATGSTAPSTALDTNWGYR